MTAEKQNTETKPQEEKCYPDFIELWKKVYFQNEEAWSNAVKEYLSTKTFNEMAHSMREQYLGSYQAGKQNLEKLLETSVIPSKKDLAGVAELIIALEDKIDQIDFQIHTHLHSITDNLVRMADFQQRSWEQIDLVKEKLDTIGAILNLPAEEPVLEISAPKKTDSLKKKNKARNETTG